MNQEPSSPLPPTELPAPGPASVQDAPPTPTPAQAPAPATSGTAPQDLPSPVVPGLLAVIVLLPELMLVLLSPAMIDLVRTGALQPATLVETWVMLLLVPVGIALLFLRRPGAFAAFVLAFLAGLLTWGTPFWRIVLAEVIVAFAGAGIAWLRGRRRAG